MCMLQVVPEGRCKTCIAALLQGRGMFALLVPTKRVGSAFSGLVLLAPRQAPPGPGCA